MRQTLGTIASTDLAFRRDESKCAQHSPVSWPPGPRRGTETLGGQCVRRAARSARPISDSDVMNRAPPSNTRQCGQPDVRIAETSPLLLANTVLLYAVTFLLF